MSLVQHRALLISAADPAPSPPPRTADPVTLVRSRHRAPEPEPTLGDLAALVDDVATSVETHSAVLDRLEAGLREVLSELVAIRTRMDADR